MQKFSRLLVVASLLALTLTGCGKEKGGDDGEGFSFVVYPGSHYLSQITDLFKQAHKLGNPNEPEAPATAVYDTDAELKKVAEYYASAYGYGKVAPDATNNLSAAKPPAYYRSGDLNSDVKAGEPTMAKLNLHVDTSKAIGTYTAAEVSGKANRPRITIQRPYFDPTTSQVVDRTLILMSQ